MVLIFIHMTMDNEKTAGEKISEKKVVNTKRCIDCGEVIDRKAIRCVPCYKEHNKKMFPRKACKGCGKEFRRKSKNVSGYCVECYIPQCSVFISYVISCETCGGSIIIDRANKKGRRFCNSSCAAVTMRKTLPQFIQDAETVHGNGRYNYSKVVYKGGDEKVEIVCPVHGSFWQRAENHLKERGCPKCAATYSKKERRINDYLSKCGYVFEHQKKFDDCINPRTGMKLKYDFWVPGLNTLIEYDGEQHYRSKGCKIRKHKVTPEEVEGIRFRDSVKTEYADKKGIRLIRVKFTIKNVEKYIQTKLKGDTYGTTTQICDKGTAISS